MSHPNPDTKPKTDNEKRRDAPERHEEDRPTRGSQQEKNDVTHGPADPHDDDNDNAR